MGFEEASNIQSLAIPILLQGKDIIAKSQTGTGKTAAFGIPVLEKLDYTSKLLQVVVMCPTRELVIQVAEEFQKLSKHKSPNASVVPIYGGQSIDTQFKLLSRGVQIIIATPGRLMDHMRRKTIKFDNLTTVILDEADEMLKMGFREDIETILEDAPSERQTVMFSATMDAGIKKIMTKFQKDPE
jgi:ATP-dependent RNA helicase DeaD